MNRQQPFSLIRPATAVASIVLCLCSACQSKHGPETEAVPAEQQAIVQTGTGGPEVLQLETVPVLEPGPGQVLIRAYAAAVNPIDWKLRQGRSRPRPQSEGQSPSDAPAQPPPPVRRVPGLDVAGIVVKIGADVSGVSVGDAVFGMIGRSQADGLNGAYSQYVLAPAGNVVPKPQSMTFAEAAGLATVGMTAVRTLRQVDIGSGQRVFIDGIAGGVGSIAAQIAKARGAIVIGTSSARHHEYLRSLGVDQVVDYTEVRFEDVVQPVDVFFETVNVANAERGLSILKPGGTLVSIVGMPESEKCLDAAVRCPGGGPPGAEGISEGDQLREAAGLADQDRIRIHIDREFPLAQAANAQELNAEGHTQGKIVLIIRPEAHER